MSSYQLDQCNEMKIKIFQTKRLRHVGGVLVGVGVPHNLSLLFSRFMVRKLFRLVLYVPAEQVLEFSGVKFFKAPRCLRLEFLIINL